MAMQPSCSHVLYTASVTAEVTPIALVAKSLLPVLT
jgi:hypothetical protein